MAPLPPVPPAFLVGLSLFVLTLAVYLVGLAPSITWKNTGADSGDLATAVATWGVPHPSGYPTYVLLGRLFSLIPVGDLAYRLNIMSAVAAAGAVAATYVAGLFLVRVVRLKGGSTVVAVASPAPDRRARGVGAVAGGDHLAAAVGAGALAFSPVFWGQAIIGEVYALDAFFVSGVAALVLWWLWDKQRGGGTRGAGRLVGASALFGVGLGDHVTSAAISAPLLVVAALAVRERRGGSWGLMGLGVLAGVGVYAYLPLAAGADPPIAWGDPRSWSGFGWTVTGRLYRQYVFGVPADEIARRAGAWGALMVGQLSGGVLLAAAGAWLAFRRDALLASALVFGFVVIVVFATMYNTNDSFVFLIPSLMVACLWVAVGSDYLIGAAVPWLGRPQRGGVAVAGALLLLISGATVLRSYPTSTSLEVPLSLNLRHDTEALDYGREAFATVGPGAIVVGHIDEPLFSLWYQRYVVEPDSTVVVIGRNFLQYDWYLKSLERQSPGLLPEKPPPEFENMIRAIVDRNLGQRPVYFTFRDPLVPEYDLKEDGRLFRVVGKKGPG